MKTFTEFLLTRPAFEQPRDSDERLRMEIAFRGGQLDASDEYHESLVKATRHITETLQ